MAHLPLGRLPTRGAGSIYDGIFVTLRPFRDRDNSPVLGLPARSRGITPFGAGASVSNTGIKEALGFAAAQISRGPTICPRVGRSDE